jgi:MoaA/NifB/PqqE/SkfB family radical SAM enzyme
MVREAGRWLKRQGLLRRLRVAHGEEVKHANAALNWREFWHGQTTLRSFPRIIQVGTNWTCNLKCNFCRLTLDSTQQQLRQLPKSELEISSRVLDSVLELLPYPEMITLTPLGEPLLYTRLGRILERHRELGCRNLAMTTNANIITDDRARMIVEGGVSHLFVSIDASDPATYSQMRVLGTLDKVEAALDAINRWKERLNSHFPTMTLASTFLERNVRQMPDLVDFAVRHRFQSYSIQLMEIENGELEPGFLGRHVALTKEMLLKTLRHAEGKPVDVRVHLAIRNLLTKSLSLPEWKQVSAFTDDAGSGIEPDMDANQNPGAGEDTEISALSTRGKHLTDKCHYPWYFMLIDTDGDVRPCCWAAMSFGNLNKLTFDEVWNGRKALAMRGDFLNNHIPKSCQGKHCRVDLNHPGTME